MRKSINVETVTSTLVNTYRAKLWRGKVEELVKSVAVASTDYVNGYQQKLKGEIEFANANLDLLSENDYNWLLEQQKSPTVDSTESKRSLSIDSPEFKEALAEAPFVCKTHDNSDTEVMDKFKKLASSFTAASNAVKDAISKPKLTISSTESQKRLWVVQITKGKKVWYKTSSSFTDGYISSSINDAALYTTKTDAEYYAKFIKPSNKDLYKLPFPVKVTVKEVLCTESSSRTIELVKPVVEAVEKPVTKAQVRARKPKVKEEWVLYTTDSNLTPYYYHGEIRIPTYQASMMLSMAKKFPSYGAATKAKCKLIKAGFITLEVANVEDCK